MGWDTSLEIQPAESITNSAPTARTGPTTKARSVFHIGSLSLPHHAVKFYRVAPIKECSRQTCCASASQAVLGGPPGEFGPQGGRLLVTDRMELLEAALDGMPDGVGLLSREGEVIFWNQAAQGITGFTAIELLGREMPEGLEPLLGYGSGMENREPPGALPENHRSVQQARHRFGHMVPVIASTRVLFNGLEQYIFHCYCRAWLGCVLLPASGWRRSGRSLARTCGSGRSCSRSSVPRWNAASAWLPGL